ncbi:hypothetical protein JYU23_01015 [bacterium AH-315-C07]|nr:hypothetical protein [bacterium AH-315-C07]
MKDYCLFVKDVCPGCQEVKNYIDFNKICVRIINLSKEQTHMPVHIIPALFHDEKLIAYGENIINYFEKLTEREKAL